MGGWSARVERQDEVQQQHESFWEALSTGGATHAAAEPDGHSERI